MIARAEEFGGIAKDAPTPTLASADRVFFVIGPRLRHRALARPQVLRAHGPRAAP
ncbi:hypothetical protein ACFOM8_08310 [Paracoccus angustae]|uniref:Uncharacterized protein n=1 Tax=Paracoccus angustae TaxID=1671480 RepID=A0ABV7U301_9RHOB